MKYDQYKQVKYRQRFHDRLTREQRRMPMHLTPILTMAQAVELLRRRSTEVTIARQARKVEE